MAISKDVLTRLDSFPRLPLAEYPTPLEFLPRLSRQLKRTIYVKRDDELGPGMGGNKTRKLEYLLAEAQARGASRVVTFGGLQSNHARLTAAAACKLGFEPHLFYFEPRPKQLTGNLLLNSLLGAHLHFIPFGGGGNSLTLEQTIRLVHWVARLRVGPHYFIPVGGHTWTGCLGYVRAAIEIDSQVNQQGLERACLVVAAGSGGTLAGLMAGLALVESPIRLIGIDVGKLWKAFPASIASLAGEICAHLGQAVQFSPTSVPLVEDRYVGQRYGMPSADGQAAMRCLARTEGLLLDPVYTSKACAGLLDLAAGKELRLCNQSVVNSLPESEEALIFLHTGGSPAIFA